MNRSVSTELELEPGTYSILMKITATRDPRVETLEEAVRRLISNPDKREKLLQVGLAYDLAHAKGLITLTEEEKRAKAEQEARDKKAAKKKAREEAKKSKLNEWYYQKRAYERTQRQKERKVEHKRKKQDALSAKQSTKAEEDLARDEQQGDGAAKQANGIATPGIEDGAAQEEEVRKHLDDEDGNEADTEDIAASEDEAEHGQSDPLTREKIKQFNAEVDSSDHGSRRFHPPRVQVNGQEVPGETGLPSPPQSPFLVPPPVDHGEQSDSESSVLTFVSSIDTILDLNNFDIEYEDRGGIDDIVDEDNEIDNENMEFADDPWNAVCVVGLRVYTTNGEVSVAVVRPKVGGNENDEAPLDLDDVSKGISEEGKKQAPTGA